MTQLVASPFSVSRKLTPILFITGIFAYTILVFQAQNLDVDLSHLFASQQGRNSSELSFVADKYVAELIRKHDLSPRVEWTTWSIESTQSQEEWNSLTRVPRRFQPREPRLFDSRSSDHLSPTEFGMLALPSPQGWRPGQFDASRYLFGVSTTYERLMEDDRAMLKNWQWWLTDGGQDGNGAHLVIMLDRADERQIEEVEGALEVLDISAMVYNSGDALSTATRYAQLAGELHAYGLALLAVGNMKTWFILIDDDIFFSSLSYLDEKLDPYGSQNSVYIGVPSEQEDWAVRDGKLSTSGGGVVILSRDALAHYLALECADMNEASDSSIHALRWAALLHSCMTTRGELSMHVIPGLYSPTVDSPESSWLDDLENGARPVAVRSHGPGLLDLARAYLVADTCGEACFAQRFLFRDSWVLVNGVSISQYQRPIRIQDGRQRQDKAGRELLSAQLQLNDDAGGGRVHLTGGGARNVWRLLDSSVDEHGVVWQAYVKRDGGKVSRVQKDEQLDSVILLVWNEAER
ncbi:hypothetical protein LLEC1_07463 [Akanthomyces lecanii]|uniref:Glycosyltransferase family 31 protein n=1 Tax=Cordyceps confragosa TaxID=2714763 RepID=A0A179IMJ4_CORDF|nr:hypothetical protein LLEC1_07463 [Akanthomyces lecanii]